MAVHENATVAQAIEHIRKAATGEDAFYLYVVDDHDHLVGVGPAAPAARRPIPPRRCARSGSEDVESVTVDTDQEEVARLVQRYNVIEVPVVDGDRRLLGTISVDDVIDVIHEEATEDIQRLGGVAGDETVLDPPQAVFTQRLIWRLINLGTAVLAASVIGLFEGSIQTPGHPRHLHAHRGLDGRHRDHPDGHRGGPRHRAGRHDRRRAAPGARRRRCGSGSRPGWPTASSLRLIAYLWKGQLAARVASSALALVFNMVVAAVVGTLVPIALKTFRVDPAIASSVIITTFTDVCGFFSFLGLATLMMRFLL